VFADNLSVSLDRKTDKTTKKYRLEFKAVLFVYTFDDSIKQVLNFELLFQNWADLQQFEIKPATKMIN
jgi:hypothetical protein